MNAIFQLLNPNNTVSVNRPLAHAIGLNEAVVYGALVAKYYWYSDRGMLDDGWFYSTAPDLQESTALTEKQQKRCVDALVKLGLLRCELRGMPAKRSFYIIEEIDLIQSLLAAGEAAMRQIKPADMIDGMDFEQLKEERACYAQIVRDNTDYDILVEQFPEQADEINELISIMVDVICSQKKTIRANGEEKPHDVVKSRLLKLNSSHIEYVLAALKKNTSDVRNIRSYLITALYNAPVTMSSFYRAEVNHDMFGKR